MTTNEKIARLRELMAQKGIDIYLIPTDDFHMCEYVGEYFKERSFLTGFTGSAGTAVVTMDEAHLWTDGRYFVQAAHQLEGSEFVLEKSGQPNVLTVKEFIASKLQKHQCLGFDGRCVSAKEAAYYFDLAMSKEAVLDTEWDLVGEIWTHRPLLPKSKTFILEDKYTGESTFSKLTKVKAKFSGMGADAHLITSLYDIAYLLNMRGDDIPNVPVFLSYLLIMKAEVLLFADSTNWSKEIFDYLAQNEITLKGYDEIYSYLSGGVLADKSVLLEQAVVNYNLIKALPSSAKIIDAENPSVMMRAVKNETEIKNTKLAHIKDGVACTKAIKYIKENIGKITLDEIAVADCFEKYRKEQEHFLDLSFDTIAAYGPNAAMMHYSAKPGTQATLKNEGFVLVDSGAHYLEGTTDITRTIALGPLTRQMKEYYTVVLRSHLRLMAATFLKGITGIQLDMLARGPVWDLGLDYRCGTGHGVGHILNVHEGPNAFRYKTLDKPSAEIVPGMITTDEPGLYIEDGFGIRIENELLCVEKETTEYGDFRCFEALTVCPIDLEPVLPELLTQYEKETLNQYHSFVRKTLKPYLSKEEYLWLEKETREI